jgi:hypothetical protein
MTQRMGDGQPRPFDWLKQQSSSFSNSFKYDFPAAKINFKNIWYRSLKIRNKWNITLWFLLENIDGQQSLIRKKRVCAGSTYKYSPHPLHPLEPPPPLVGERGGEKRIDEERGAWPLPSCLLAYLVERKMPAYICTVYKHVCSWKTLTQWESDSFDWL